MWGKPGKPGKQIAPAPLPAPSGRVIHGRVALAVTTVPVPDAYAVQAASLGIMTNTFSPASAGHRYFGDPGFGVNRWAGRTIGPVQHFFGAAQSALRPATGNRLGIGAGTAGQPGLPNTGGTDNLGPVARMSVAQVANRFSFGGG